MIIRKIQASDNPKIASIIREVLTAFGANRDGFAFADPELDTLFETFNKPKAAYFILESEGRVLGGAGYQQLAGANADICELQKMYMLPQGRGQGMGQKLLSRCLESAKQDGFKECYLETLNGMAAAQSLYLKNGFKPIDKPMGNTGHHGCNVFMVREL